MRVINFSLFCNILLIHYIFTSHRQQTKSEILFHNTFKHNKYVSCSSIRKTKQKNIERVLQSLHGKRIPLDKRRDGVIGAAYREGVNGAA